LAILGRLAAIALAQGMQMLEVLVAVCRGLASLWVFTFHLRPEDASAQSWLWNLAAIGDLGVPVFFVISGFCIYASALNTIATGRSTRSFISRRLKRIYPPFWAAVLVTLAVPFAVAALSALKAHHWIPPSPRWYSMSWTDWILLASLGKVFFSHGNSLDRAFNAVNSVYWSLAIEVQFYAVIAAAMNWRRHFHRILLAISCVSALCLVFPRTYNTGLFLPYWPMFALGILLYRFVNRPHSPRPVSLKDSSLAVLSVVLLVAVACGYRLHVLDLPFLLYHTGFAACIALLLANSEGLNTLLNRFKHKLAIRAMVGLGTISYSLYLIHAAMMKVPAMIAWQFTTMGSLSWAALVIVPTILISYAFYRGFEKPFVAVRHPRVKTEPSPPVEALPEAVVSGAVDQFSH
jgi:peptidoglycan/LPS O-acetylase OafA/YrhL